VPATFYIASLPFQDTPQNGGYVCGWPRRLDHAPWSASGPVR